MSLKAKQPVARLRGLLTPASEDHAASGRIWHAAIETLAARYYRAESTSFFKQQPIEL